MKLTVPVSSPGEIGLLKTAGADEIYCGCQPPEWKDAYGDHDSASRRQGAANLRSIEELIETAKEAAMLHMPAWLALNGRYVSAQYPQLLDMAKTWAEAGGYGLILRDMGFLCALREMDFPLKLAASLLMLCVNAEGVRLLKKQGISRIVLPRFLTLNEMKQIAGSDPEMEYEAMVFKDHCPMIDGLCQSVHSTDCSPLCAGISRKSPHPCAACRMEEMDVVGIHFGKLGGRGTPLDERYRETAFCAYAAKNTDLSEIQAVYRSYFEHDCDCYYQ